MITDVSFFYKGGRAGVLLIHGLTGTPAEMQILGKGLHKHGFTVYGMQLAGHCGDENDLLATSWHDWYDSVIRAADRLLEHVDTCLSADFLWVQFWHSNIRPIILKM